MHLKHLILKQQKKQLKKPNMHYRVRIWNGELFKKEIMYEADNEVIAMQKASAATPDGCRANYESINKEEYEKSYEDKTKEQAEA